MKIIVGQETGVRVKNKFIGAGKMKSLMVRGQIIKGKIELRLGAIDCNGPTGETVILKTERGIKNDNVLVKTDVRRMSPKPRDF